MKKWLLILLVHFLPLLFCREVSWSFSGDGEGTETAPYIITDVMQLQEMNLDLEAHYVLNNDIDASSTISWNEDLGFGPIGDFSIPFTGSFNGNSHNITGLTINRTSMIGVGLFGYVEDATIEDVGIEGGYITGGSNVGALVGSNLRGIVIKCYASSHITGIGFGVGGLIGLNLNGTVADSYATGDVSGKGAVGGLVGQDGMCTVLNSYATGMVTGTGDNSSEIGGLIGRNTYGRSIQCFATGAVSGENKVGGLFGYCEGGEILDNFATGKANGKESNIGGLIGSGWDVLISSSYATGSASGTNSVGGFLGFLGGNFITSTVSDCYAMGSVAGGRGVGGLVGGTDGGHTAVENSYAVGMVTGDEMVGGLVGDDFAITVEHSYWDIENAGQSFSAGGTGKTTAEMYHQGTFEGWNFDTVWWIDEGNNYPRFYWEPGAPLMPAPLFLNAGSDINLDNKVDAEDLLILLEDWGKVSTP